MVRWGQTDYSAESAERGPTRLPAGPLSRRAAADRRRPAQRQLQGRRRADPADAGCLAPGRMVLGPDGFFDGLLFDPDDCRRLSRAAAGQRIGVVSCAAQKFSRSCTKLRLVSEPPAAPSVRMSRGHVTLRTAEGPAPVPPIRRHQFLDPSRPIAGRIQAPPPTDSEASLRSRSGLAAFLRFGATARQKENRR